MRLAIFSFLKLKETFFKNESNAHCGFKEFALQKFRFKETTNLFGPRTFENEIVG